MLFKNRANFISSVKYEKPCNVKLELLFTNKNRAVWVIFEPIQNRAISSSVLFRAVLYEALLYLFLSVKHCLYNTKLQSEKN